MLVHAHPDDESSQSAATMAHYVAEGAAVTLVTCTLGELGEIVTPELDHLRDKPTELGRHRLGELAAAMAQLGVTDFVRLGGDGRWSDSGMAYDEATGFAIPAEDLPDNAFWKADLLAAATDLVALIRDRRPQVLITYDSFGHYGHPDHIQAHRVTHYAYTLAAAPAFRPDLGPAWQVDRILWSASPADEMRAMIRVAKEAAADRDDEGPSFFAAYDPDGPDDPPMSTPNRYIVARIAGAPWRAQRLAALRAHRSQITEEGIRWFTDEDHMGPFMNECYVLGAGTPPPGVADDLFAGIDSD